MNRNVWHIAVSGMSYPATHHPDHQLDNDPTMYAHALHGMWSALDLVNVEVDCQL